ncbi:hypothetical protein Tco_1464761 [Tanacetum coccineum]
MDSSEKYDADVHQPLWWEADPHQPPPPDSDNRVPRNKEDCCLHRDDHEPEAEANTVGTITSTLHSQIKALPQSIFDRITRTLNPEKAHKDPYKAAYCLPVAPVDRADPDDPSPHPTRRPRHDDPCVMVRDAATRNEAMIALLLM